MGTMIGREAELATLKAAWAQAVAGRPQLVIIWGRRRVGKTYLLSQFAEAKRAIYFTATRQDSEARQLARFADHVAEQLGDEVRDLVPEAFADWDAALRFVIRLAQDRELLVVIDEAPRLLVGRPDFADLVSAVWEGRVRTQRLMLVLTGSAVGVMEKMVGPDGGLHRRASIERRIDPFTFANARQFLPDLQPDDFLHAYAACGGYPLHLLRWDPTRSPEENVIAEAFSPGGLLTSDAFDILSEDLDWRGGYERVLAAIGAGLRRRSRIAGRAQQRIDYTLDRLRRAGYVRQIRPLGAGAAADPHYEIVDDYLAFWFTVIRDDADLIEGGQGQAVRRRVDGKWRRHLGRVLEAAAREHATSLVTTGKLPPDMLIGRTWIDETVEIDVAGLRDDRIALVGECRLQTKPLVLRDLADLRRKVSKLTNLASEPTYAFWSRGSAEPALDAAPGVLCFTLDNMVTQTRGPVRS